MGITVTALPGNTPPKFAISIAPTNGAAVTAISLTRTINGLTVQTRVQPTIGPSPRLVDDYEADWDTPVTYTASVTTASGTETFPATPTTLTVTAAWMIHPTTPALSCMLDNGTSTIAGVRTFGTITRTATTTSFRPIGSEYSVPIRTGPRAAGKTEMVWATTTELERSRFTAMTRDQTPILFRVPASFGWGFRNGYYDIGDITEDRRIQYGFEARRDITVPMEHVDTPTGVQQAARTWADVLAGFGTWSAIPNTYNTWTDVLTDTRR